MSNNKGREKHDTTIAAIATAVGEGGIGIVKISGKDSLHIMEKVFSPAVKPKKVESRKFYYGIVSDKKGGKTIDEAMAVFMKGPKTYTGEDVVEIYCHGGVVALGKTLESVYKNGAEPAEPGEFTKRAFLNGRLDLTQAEAVIDLIKAKADKGYDTALDQLEGRLSKRIKEIINLLTDLLVDLAVNIDYPDEDIEEMTIQNTSYRLSQISDMIEKLLDSADTGRMLRDGIEAVIIGKPNVGKSSLMNELLKESRAIVTEIPGTTRDTIEEYMSIKGIPVKITDTAGIRKTQDPIEKIGIEKSKEAFNKADLIILMLDGSDELSEEDIDLLQRAENKETIVLINKKDLGEKISSEKIRKLLPKAGIFKTSLKDEEVSKILEKEIQTLVYGGKLTRGERGIITNARQKILTEKALEAIKNAKEQAECGVAFEFLEVDVNLAREFLGEITGDFAVADIIDQVFSRFCLGK